MLKAAEKVVEYCVSASQKLFGAGIVAEVDFSEEEIREAIDAGKLYFIDNPNYPKTDEEKRKAKCRCHERLNENSYALAYNNCEHLITFILTGNPYSEQIKKAGGFKMFLVDTFDVFISHASRNTVKMILTSLIGCIPIVRYGAKLLPIGASLLITSGIEALLAWINLKQLKIKQIKKHVNESDYQREAFRTKGGAIGATVGSVIGSCLGLAFLPFPVLGPTLGPKVGCVVGSMVGNYAGRWIGYVFSGCFYDKWYGK